MFSFHYFQSKLNQRTEAQDQEDSGIHLSLPLTFFTIFHKCFKEEINFPQLRDYIDRYAYILETYIHTIIFE